jgi:predicted kinase
MHGKVLVLLRGVPGAGKSSFANFVWNSGVIFEADKFFDTPDGGYKFDATKLKEAHEWCRLGVQTAMEENIQTNGQYYPEIIVSNTFTREWEMQAYVDLAKEFGYTVVSLIVENRHGGVNQHGVPEEKVQEMRDRFEVKL